MLPLLMLPERCDKNPAYNSKGCVWYLSFFGVFLYTPLFEEMTLENSHAWSLTTVSNRKSEAHL